MDVVKNFCDKYYVNRRETNSVKWDGLNEKFGETDLMPLWVADMDFKVPEVVQEALMKRVDHGVFGYTFVPRSYYKAFNHWHASRHNYTIKTSWLRFCTGVVNAFNYVIQATTGINDSVLVLSPVYYPFYDAVLNNQRNLVTCDLINTQGEYSLDYENFEELIKKNKVKVFLHCSPQNPVGKIWQTEELNKLFDICHRYGVKVISDEIHQDFVVGDETFISALTLSKKYHELLYVLNAPSKTFNLASLLHAHVIIPNEKNREQYDSYIKKIVNNPVSVMGMIATEACYNQGEVWLDDLLEVINYNEQLMIDMLSKELPKVIISPRQATYLAWVDLSAYVAAPDLIDVVQKQAKLAVDYGDWFGDNGKGFIRINLATSPNNIEQAISRLIKAIK
ncbi:MalY/PatB family protein [Vagococcus vulneris]|uniref:cysteine-S-conjugate beta-lyase n=1 Tax=Vagococcus vulneris TaxID=1977869 RepID=A0A430A1J5_9ENTE|nr:MalY/PatB family protein [Vagococcus vulneris]RSU00268.1 aminotransferase [Vagococcus vulneris]